jgi:hypothetical protein
MSANLMVRPCSCPARDTLCSGGQMLSMSQMGQTLQVVCRHALLPEVRLDPKTDLIPTPDQVAHPSRFL